MANYHPTDELLTAFSAGSLQLAHALCVSSHIEMCSQCRQNLHRLNSIGATLLAELKPEKVSQRLKDDVLAMLDRQIDDENTAAKQAVPININTAIPRCLQQFVPQDYDALRWQTISPSIQSTKLCTDINGAKVELLRIKPGGKAAAHTHTGDEYTMILEGSFSDETGIYCEGDFILRDGRHKHKPIAAKNKECICLTVTDAPIQFTGFFTRWLNPLVRRSYLPSL